MQVVGLGYLVNLKTDGSEFSKKDGNGETCCVRVEERKVGQILPQ